MISSAMAAVKPRATACGDKSSAKGVVKVHVKVGANGGIVDVSVAESPDAGLGACVVAAVRKASFPKTKAGGSFKYPFPF
jgi:TonB family protein